MEGSAMVQPNLPFGDINVLVLTDVHSWVGSHRHQEVAYDADFGDILSFYERLKDYCNENEIDLWFVSNGDWAHGTGLGAPGDPSHLLPLLQKMPWDALNCGNHELYENEKVEAMIRPAGFIDWFGDRYLTSNLLRAQDPKKHPLGHRYKVLEGINSRLLTFGFLYNMGDSCDLVEVAKVEDVVREKWFLHALKEEDYDAILVLAHMDLHDPLVEVIRKAIRKVAGPDLSIQFITGHTHYRGVKQLDDASSSVESGRYLDTLGFASFPSSSSQRLLSNSTDAPEEDENPFQSVFLDANIKTLAETLNLDKFATPNGKALSKFISITREKTGMTREIGCAPMPYTREVAMENENSLYRLYRDEVVPEVFFSQVNSEKDTASVMFIPTESFRYDLFSSSKLIVDDIWAVAPFNDTIVGLGTFMGSSIVKLNATLNLQESQGLDARVPRYLLIGDVDDSDKQYTFYTHDFGSGTLSKRLKEIEPDTPIQSTPTPYTSTELWLAFVAQSWSCSGLAGSLPQWFPTPDKVTTHIGQGGNETALRAVSSMMAVLLVLVAVFAVLCCIHLVRRLYRSTHRVHEDETEAFKRHPVFGDGDFIDA